MRVLSQPVVHERIEHNARGVYVHVLAFSSAATVSACGVKSVTVREGGFKGRVGAREA